MKRSNSNILPLIAISISVLVIATSNGQIVSTPCTSGMINSFTPCMNYITGSSSNGTTSPTADCCASLKELTAASMDCACLLVSASVPLPLTAINRSIAISLPKACKSSVPLQCQASVSPLPAPGPAQLAPPPSSSAFTPRASKAAATDPVTAPTDTPAFSPADVESPPAPGGIRPLLTPSGSTRSYTTSSPAAIILTFVALFMALRLH
ncbi:hypothetical protein V2J09_018415 [Rumex salicifolius]